MNFSAPVAAPPRMPPPPVVGKLVIAQFDYSAQAADELSLQKGCVVEVTDDSDSGWWEGKYGGKKGIFPANYVKPK